MTAASLLDFWPGLWFVALAATIAAASLGRLSWHGPFPAMAGMIATAGLGFIAMSYWWEIATGDRLATAEMRRAAALVLWPALAYCFGTLMRSTYLLER